MTLETRLLRKGKQWFQVVHIIISTPGLLGRIKYLGSVSACFFFFFQISDKNRIPQGTANNWGRLCPNYVLQSLSMCLLPADVLAQSRHKYPKKVLQLAAWEDRIEKFESSPNDAGTVLYMSPTNMLRASAESRYLCCSPRLFCLKVFDIAGENFVEKMKCSADFLWHIRHVKVPLDSSKNSPLYSQFGDASLDLVPVLVNVREKRVTCVFLS